MPETKIAGVIKTTVPFLGGGFDDFGQILNTENPNVFWIFQLDDKKIVVYHVTKGMPTDVDWSDCS